MKQPNVFISPYDVLNEESFFKIRTYFESPHPQWRFESTSKPVANNYPISKSGYFFCHLIKPEISGEYPRPNKTIQNKVTGYKFLKPIINYVESVNSNNQYLHIEEAKAITQYRKTTDTREVLLVDRTNFHKNSFSIIYFLDNSDGNLVLFKELHSNSTTINKDNLNLYKKIMPTRNRLIMFETSRVYASCSPSIFDTKRYIHIIGEYKDTPFDVNQSYVQDNKLN